MNLLTILIFEVSDLQRLQQSAPNISIYRKCEFNSLDLTTSVLRFQEAYKLASWRKQSALSDQINTFWDQPIARSKRQQQAGALTAAATVSAPHHILSAKKRCGTCAHSYKLAPICGLNVVFTALTNDLVWTGATETRPRWCGDCMKDNTGCQTRNKYGTSIGFVSDSRHGEEVNVSRYKLYHPSKLLPSLPLLTRYFKKN